MIILQINIVDFAFHEPKRDAPIAAHPDRPLASSVALESMKIETVGINIGQLLSGVERVQAAADPCCEVRRYATPTSSLKKLPESLVTERPNRDRFQRNAKLSCYAMLR